MCSLQDKSVLFGPSYNIGHHILIHRVLEDNIQSQKIENKVALIFNASEITFGQLNDKATHLAKNLLRMTGHCLTQSHEQEHIVAICLEPNLDLIISILAVWKIGAAYLPFDPSFPLNRAIHILSDSKPKIFLTSRSVLDSTSFTTVIKEYESVIFYLEEQKDQPESFQLHDEEIHSDVNSLAAVLYTSGSTGAPKGVRIMHRNIFHRIFWQWKQFPFSADEVCCFKTSFTFVDSIGEIWAPLVAGVPLVIVPKGATTNIDLFIDLLESSKITRLVLVPSLLKATLTRLRGPKINRDKRLECLKMWICSGEVLSMGLLMEFFDYFEKGYTICNFYGSTEVTGDVTFAVFQSRLQIENSVYEQKVPIGRPLDNCRVYLLNSETDIVEPGMTGEIYAAGSHVAAGYMNGREMNRFIPNMIDPEKGYEILFRTGDYGRIINNTLYYDGRTDTQIKVRGHRVDISEIDTIINRMDGISKGIVLCYKPGEPEQEIISFVVFNGSTLESFKESLKTKLLPYMIPKVIEVENIPLLVNGKVDRQQLLQLYTNGSSKTDADLHVEEEWDSQTKLILDTVSSAIGVSFSRTIQLYDNFFDIGGHSLNAVSVVTQLQDQGVPVDLTDFLCATNFAEIVSKVKSVDICVSARISEKYRRRLTSEDKDTLIKIISTSFSEKAELELLTGVQYQDYEEFLVDLWGPLLAADLSFVVCNNAGKILSVALNFDVFDEPQVQPKVQRLAYVFEFLEWVESQAREKYFCKQVNHYLHSFMMATDESLESAENVELIHFMEMETLKLASERGFKAVFTTNTNELTRQICDDVLNYQVLLSYQVKQYIAQDGTRPFMKAQDTQYSVVTVKFLDQ